MSVFGREFRVMIQIMKYCWELISQLPKLRLHLSKGSLSLGSTAFTRWRHKSRSGDVMSHSKCIVVQRILCGDYARWRYWPPLNHFNTFLSSFHHTSLWKVGYINSPSYHKRQFICLFTICHRHHHRDPHSDHRHYHYQLPMAAIWWRWLHINALPCPR